MTKSRPNRSLTLLLNLSQQKLLLLQPIQKHWNNQQKIVHVGHAQKLERSTTTGSKEKQNQCRGKNRYAKVP